MQTQYYYKQLNKQQQAVYHAMLEGLKAVSASFSAPRLSDREIFEICFLVRLDHPELFYVEKISYRYYDHADSVEIVPDYLFDKKKLKTHQQAMKARVDKLSRPATQLSKVEQLQYIHDFICQNVTYDKLKKQYSHEIIGPLGQGVGVCEGIAKTVKILCDALGIGCIIAIAEANPDKQIKYRHAWNIIELDGMYYHFDATFDNSLSQDGIIRYDYFLLDDAHIFRDHESLVWPVPSCTNGENSYYRQKKLSFTRMEDVQKRAGQAVKKGKPLVFHWRGGGLSKDSLQQILQCIEDEAKVKGKHSRISVNLPQAVFQITFQNQPQETVVQESVDVEGNVVQEEIIHE